MSSNLDKLLLSLVSSIELAWALAVRHLLRILGNSARSKSEAKSSVRIVFRALDRANAHFARSIVPLIYHSEYRAAEELLDEGTAQPANDALTQHTLAFYHVLKQMTDEAQANVMRLIDEGYQQNMPVADNLEFQKKVTDAIEHSVTVGGRRYDPEGAAKALVRTRVNQLQNEAALERYVKAGITEVEFHVGTTPCNFHGVVDGKPQTCEQLDGQRWPIDAIPPGVIPPRHVFGNSRLTPVVR